MLSLLLVVIYVAFISLGLPDALLGASWPVMHLDLGVDIELAGLLQMTIAGGTILSSMYAGRMLRRFGAGPVTAVSVALTALALLGFSLFPSFLWYFLGVIPLGIGAGAVDTGLNAFVAEHFESRHMSWLHSFWGVGALGGPLVLSRLMAAGFTWRNAYFYIALFQFCLVFILIISLPLWKLPKTSLFKADSPQSGHKKPKKTSNFDLLKITGVPFALFSFVFYCGVEASMGLWGGSWLVEVRKLDAASAAFWVSTFFGGIALGRFLTGFLTRYISNRNLIRGGVFAVGLAILCLILPLPLPLTLAAFVFAGLGCAPIFPCMIHETPLRFGLENSQSIIGLQMASAYVGITFLPPFFGLLSRLISLSFLPLFLAINALFLLASSERLRHVRAGR